MSFISVWFSAPLFYPLFKLVIHSHWPFMHTQSLLTFLEDDSLHLRSFNILVFVAFFFYRSMLFASLFLCSCSRSYYWSSILIWLSVGLHAQDSVRLTVSLWLCYDSFISSSYLNSSISCRFSLSWDHETGSRLAYTFGNCQVCLWKNHKMTDMVISCVMQLPTTSNQGLVYCHIETLLVLEISRSALLFLSVDVNMNEIPSMTSLVDLVWITRCFEFPLCSGVRR